MLSGSLNGVFGCIQIQRCYPFWFTSSCFQIQTCIAAHTGDGQFTLSDMPALAGFVQGGGGRLDWPARPRGAHGVFNSPTLGQRAPVLTAHCIPSRAPMKTHEGEACWVNGLLDRSRKIRIFGRLQDFARALVLLKFLHVRGQGFPASFLWGLLFCHDNLGLLLRDRMKVSCSDARVCLFSAAVVVVVVVIWWGWRRGARGWGIGGRRRWARWRGAWLWSFRHIFLNSRANIRYCALIHQRMIFCFELYVLGFSVVVPSAFSLSCASEAPFLALCKKHYFNKCFLRELMSIHRLMLQLHVFLVEKSFWQNF